MSSKRCFYEVLGVSREASADEVRRAYKQLALKHHPDRNQGDRGAEAQFKEVNEAYQILSDDEKRRMYDQFGHAAFDGSLGQGGFPGGAGDVFAHMQDLFSEMFSGGGGFGRQQRRGGDLRLQQKLSFQEACFGVKKEVVVHAPARCGDCGGSGARAGTKPETCPHCRGAGHVSNARGFVMFTATCPKCQGQGAVIKYPCKTCEGHGVVERPRKVVVAFPAGVDAGQRLRVPGQGLPGPNGTQPGDLYVEIDVEEDARFERDGADLVARVHVGFTDAALGADIEVPGIDEAEPNKLLGVTLPPGTQPGSVITLKGQGVPRLDGRGRGSLVVVVQLDVPKALSGRARELLAELDAELRGQQADATEASRRRAAAAK
ncbi:MAG TPA: molecular chaperone DnaJ [Polyangiaceae bacterium]|jgi:molecular chaperone DnaJ